MAELTPEIDHLLEQIRHLALSLEEAQEYFPWGTRAYFRSIKGRNFMLINEQPGYLDVTLRLPQAAKHKALRLPFIQPARSMGQGNWITARLQSAEELADLLPLISLSHAMSKPFRGKDDMLAGEPPAVLDFLDQVRQAVNRYDDIEEYFPFGDRAFRKRKGQIFVYASEREDSLYVNVRLPLGERDYALSLPFVDIPKYIGPKGWVGASVRTQEEMEIVLPWIGVSFDMNQPARKGKPRKPGQAN